MSTRQNKKKKWETPRVTTIRVKNAADFLAKSDEEIRQFLKEKLPKKIT